MSIRFTPGIRAPEDDERPVLCFVFRRRELLVTVDHEIPDLSALDASGLDSVRSQYLGSLEDTHCHSVELSPDAPAPDGMVFRDLRALYGNLDESLHAVAGRAVQIVEWDRTHQFCGACGSQTEASKTERSRVCPDCGLAQFPRLSPAIIVAVEKGDEILLGRSPHFPPGIFSVLAGFVEPGESLEECVAREVFEETAIEVADVRYFSSQPWPFPNSVMLGFTAQYAGGEIEVDGAEIEAADWYRYDELPHTFPGNLSISQWLVRDFVERKRGGR